MIIKLKKDFQLGAASAATQIEGGELDHSWNDWYHKGNIIDGTNPARANQHYEKYQEDIQLMEEMNLQIYRFGIEWARIEPEEGIFCRSAIDHYRDLLIRLKSANIKPLLTLHHFTNPMWFEQKGGFTKKENIDLFLTFVAKVIEELGDLVEEYITINEPNVYATQGYFFGSWPPGEKKVRLTMKVMSVLATAHIQAYQLIHQIRKEKNFPNWGQTKVSFANHVRAFTPKNPWNPWHQVCCKISRRFFQDALSKAMCLGEFGFPLKNISGIKKGDYCDFHGVNYYTRTTVTGLKDGVRENAPVNDLGWEIYPQGIIECSQQLYDMVKKPIYITENGTCDDKDCFRSRYIFEHLKVINESVLPIERYYHWCFTDNFEWIEGESARFGLVHIDYDTQKRTVKESGNFYTEIIKHQGVTEKMQDQYLKGISYSTNAK